MIKDKGIFIGYVFTVTIVILLVFEFAILPWHYKLPRDIALIGFVGKPGTVVNDTSINSVGFTGDLIDTDRYPDEVRILTLGGSAMFNRRMTERLIVSLNKISRHPVKIMGAALQTHTSISSVIKYRTLSKYKFDYVLIYHAINDLFVNNVYVDYFKSDYSHMDPWYRRNRILDNSLVARAIYNNIIWGRKIFGTGSWYLRYVFPDKYLENAMDFESERLFGRNMTTLVQEIKHDGATPILMTFAWNIPDHYTREAFESGELGYAATNFKSYPVELWGSVGFVKEGIRRHNKVIREIAKDHGTLFIDQENLMGKDLRMFEDVCHLSDEGTETFIQHITEFFQKNKLL